MSYSQVNPDDMILRDRLAIDRTVLANERTFLAYVRTSIMFFVSGLSIVKLFADDIVLVVLGYFLMPISIVILLYAYIKFLKIKKKFDRLNLGGYTVN